MDCLSTSSYTEITTFKNVLFLAHPVLFLKQQINGGLHYNLSASCESGMQTRPHLFQAQVSGNRQVCQTWVSGLGSRFSDITLFNAVNYLVLILYDGCPRLTTTYASLILCDCVGNPIQYITVQVIMLDNTENLKPRFYVSN